MQNAGNESWRFSEAIDQLPHAALFVRDSLDLQVPDGPAVPPRLVGSVPEFAHRLEPSIRDAAGQHWTIWWEAILTLEARVQLGDQGADRGEWRRSLAGVFRDLIDPPEWRSLTDRPALLTAVRMTFGDGCRWSDTARRPLLPPIGRPLFEWSVTRDMVKAVAIDLGVRVGTLAGCVNVLMVEGSWWCRFAPGVVLCSIEATRDPETTKAILHAAFAARP